MLKQCCSCSSIIFGTLSISGYDSSFMLTFIKFLKVQKFSVNAFSHFWSRDKSLAVFYHWCKKSERTLPHVAFHNNRCLRRACRNRPYFLAPGSFYSKGFFSVSFWHRILYLLHVNLDIKNEECSFDFSNSLHVNILKYIYFFNTTHLTFKI